MDALLLTGGGDIDPALYGADSRDARNISAERDETEIALVLEARRRGIPTLAICRGIQVLNVALGGTLIQDIGKEWPGALPHDPGVSRTTLSHRITVAGGSRTEAALGTAEAEVNSIHHQAVDRLAEGLQITARADDGVVEAVEAVDPEWWAVGVQWHPEDLAAESGSPHRGLFAALQGQLAR